MSEIVPIILLTKTYAKTYAIVKRKDYHDHNILNRCKKQALLAH